MLWRDVYNTCKKYTDDIIVISMIRNWLILFAIFKVFNFSIKRKFKLNIERHETDGEVRIDFYISVGIFRKHTLSISDVIKKKKEIHQQANKKKPVVYIDTKEKEPEQSEVVIEFYEWKKKMIAKQFGLATG